MAPRKSFSDMVFDVKEYSDAIYYSNEIGVARYMAKRWPDAFEFAAKKTGSDSPSVLEAADFGSRKISDKEAFLSDFRELLRTLGKGCRLNSDGEWG